MNMKLDLTFQPTYQQMLSNFDFNKLSKLSLEGGNLEGINKYYELNRFAIYDKAKQQSYNPNPQYAALYGLLIGDAIGQPLEFLYKPYNESNIDRINASEYKKVDYYQDGQKLPAFKSGYFTDDGSMALCNLVGIKNFLTKYPNILKESNQLSLNHICELSSIFLNLYSFWISDRYHCFLSTTKNLEDVGISTVNKIREYQYLLSTLNGNIQSHDKKLELAQKSKNIIESNIHNIEELTLNKLEEIFNVASNQMWQNEQIKSYIHNSLFQYDEQSSNSGNGSLMKLAPITIEIYKQFKNDIEVQSLLQLWKQELSKQNNDEIMNNPNWIDGYLNHPTIYKLIKLSSQFNLVSSRTIHNSLISDYSVITFNILLVVNMLFNDIGLINDSNKSSFKFKNQYFNSVFQYIKELVFNELKMNKKQTSDNQSIINIFDIDIDKRKTIFQHEIEIIKQFFDSYKVYPNNKDNFTNLMIQHYSSSNSYNNELINQYEQKNICKSNKKIFKKIKELFIKEDNYETPVQKLSILNNDWCLLSNKGFVIDTLITAINCFYYNNSFKNSIVDAINVYGDADTIGAVCGQLSGSYYGYDHINVNKDWIDGLQYKDLINFIIAQ